MSPLEACPKTTLDARPLRSWGALTVVSWSLLRVPDESDKGSLGLATGPGGQVPVTDGMGPFHVTRWLMVVIQKCTAMDSTRRAFFGQASSFVDIPITRNR